MSHKGCKGGEGVHGFIMTGALSLTRVSSCQSIGCHTGSKKENVSMTSKGLDVQIKEPLRPHKKNY